MRINFYRTLIRGVSLATWAFIFSFIIYSPSIFNLFIPSTKMISIATWADYIDEEIVKEFEKETGIKVYLNYYDNNDELVSKLELMKENSYDLVIPTDYIVPSLIKKNLLHELDKSKLNFLDQLEPNLLGKYYDPTNTYALPYYWDVLGIGYNKKYLKRPLEQSWEVLFNEKETPGRIGLTDDPREVLSVAAQYLFGTIENLTSEQLKQLEALLLKQKQWVESYSDLRGEFLLYSGTCPVALIPSSQVWSGIKSGLSDLGFMLPKKTFMIIDNVVIPKGASTDLVYKFINFLYKKKIHSINTNKYGYFPSRKDLLDEREAYHIKGLYPKKGTIEFDRFMFMKNSISRTDLNRIWLQVKAA